MRRGSGPELAKLTLVILDYALHDPPAKPMKSVTFHLSERGELTTSGKSFVDVSGQISADAAKDTLATMPYVVALERICARNPNGLTLAALEAIDLDATRLLLIENVGNLVCPASWDLGEDAKIVVFAVTEGEDKPRKYPKMFRQARYAVLNKIDLLPYVPFDVDRALGYARDVNPDLTFFQTSALAGTGLESWLAFLRGQAGRGPAA